MLFTKIKLNAGTPQRSPLSPLIYIIYVNDLPEEIKHDCSLSQFADDIAIWTSAYTRAFSTHKLQKAVNMLEGWCRRWRVKLNGEKSKLVFISRMRKANDENHCLQLFNDIIRPVNQAKFLGVKIDQWLSFKSHFEDIHNRSKKRLNVLRVLARAGVEPKVLMKLYKIYVRPILEYGSLSFIAAPKSQLDKLQKIQNEGLRICLRLPSYIRTGLLHECASIEPINDRLLSLNSHLLRKMYYQNPDVKKLIDGTVDNGISPLALILRQGNLSSLKS